MAEFQTLGALARSLGVSRRTVDRALSGDGSLMTDHGEIRLESRAPTPAEFGDGTFRRQTSIVARVAGASPSEDLDETEIVHANEGEVDLDAAYADAVNDPGSTEATLARLERIFKGAEQRTYHTGGGKLVTGPYSEGAQLRAGKYAEDLRAFLDERARNYIQREIVADCLVALGSLLANRLSAMPARLADRLAVGMTVPEIREQLTVAIDEIRTELGDEAERQTAELLGEGSG